jgi:hypothetical protein
MLAEKIRSPSRSSSGVTPAGHPKEILGFLVDREAKTVRISDARATDIVREIRKILKKKRVQLKRYSRIVGKLRHVALILPGTKGLFSPINKELRGKPLVIGLRKSSQVRAALLDLATMVTLLASWPTHVKELIPANGHYYSYFNACATGAGGVHPLSGAWNSRLQSPAKCSRTTTPKAA